jgi:ParB-like chromosome segregation protein Spo0J
MHRTVDPPMRTTPSAGGFPAPSSYDDLSSVDSPDESPVTVVDIDSVIIADSPRLGGEDQEHIELLAETGDTLPPITLHRATMRVIDGVHRLRAATLRGRTTIEARLLDCDDDTAFILAVQANVAHGLPLSQADRKAAAVRILATHPHWADRVVAACTGLSDKTVSALRGRSTSESPRSDTRLGRDGRHRPLDSADRRREAAALLAAQPDAGLREVARATGLSPTTVRDVRLRIGRNEDPVPLKYRQGSADMPRQAAENLAEAGIDRYAALRMLGEDPSLKFSDAGRQLLRWLHHRTIKSGEWESVVVGLPDHWTRIVADLARGCATEWRTLADRLEQRAPAPG